VGCLRGLDGTPDRVRLSVNSCGKSGPGCRKPR